MRRRHLIELHEQTWVPAIWRQMFQSGLGIAGRMLKPFRHAAVKLDELLEKTGASEILDLCSGSGEAILQLHQWLGTGPTVASKPKAELRLVLSDLFPHPEEWDKLRVRFPALVSFRSDPVDVFNMPTDTPRVWTLINSLHHFREAEVRRLLTNVTSKADGVAVFESTGRTWSNMVQTIPVLPVAAIISATMLRPFRIWHPIWSLLFPIVPLIAFFDGIVSNFRTYTVEELRSIVESLDCDHFEWDIGSAPMDKTSLRATYLIGWRKELVNSKGMV